MSEFIYYRKTGNFCAVIVSKHGALEGGAKVEGEVDCFVRAKDKTSMLRMTSPSDLAALLIGPATAKANAVYWDNGGHPAEVLMPADWASFKNLFVGNVRGLLISLALEKDPVLDIMEANSSPSLRGDIEGARKAAKTIAVIVA